MVNKLGINCIKKTTCQDAVVTLKPNGQDFEYINCDAKEACTGATFTIDCDGGLLKGVTCKGIASCLDATFIITDCDLEKFECGDEVGACDGITCIDDQGIAFDCPCDPSTCPNP
eukprot:TRINITY_DN1575_c0_g1_i2.p1 TRINITY_DN1575_c0_g1~~TRINITY_DN1575_c0_g1_i2.p1  ORF type:complete len:115 (-),score=18.15 TRINITY_DN1575_c0_g1_i2:233-577(-)